MMFPCPASVAGALATVHSLGASPVAGPVTSCAFPTDPRERLRLSSAKSRRHRPVRSVTIGLNHFHPDARHRPLAECRRRLCGGVV